MIRHVFERGLASLIAKRMLDGGADALFERVARSGAMTPEQLEKLRAETRAHLEKVRDDGAAYSGVVLAAWQEVATHLPDLSKISRSIGNVALQAAAHAAQAAADQARDLADRVRVNPTSVTATAAAPQPEDQP